MKHQLKTNGGYTWAIAIVIACSVVTLGAPGAAWAQNETQISGNQCDPLEGPCGSTTNPPDPLAELSAAADNLDAMQDDLMDNWYVGGLCGLVEQGEPVVTDSGDDVSAAGGFLVYQLGGSVLEPDVSVLGSGTTNVAVTLGQPDVDVTIVMTDVDPFADPPVGVNRQWTLAMTVTASQGAVSVWGTLDYEQGTPLESASYVGGWIYSPETGPAEHPASDAGFHAEVANMFGCQETVASTNFWSNFAVVVNGVNIGIHYVLDIFHTYTPPTTDSCLGPRILDGSGQSCHGVDIPCRENLDDMAERIDGIPNVSNAFKNCMKGRAGCGGSSFPRLKIKCDDSSSCGACGANSWGCNIGGSTMSYCYPGTYQCTCVNVAFHEMAHSCGAVHMAEYNRTHDCKQAPNDTACEVGEWFHDKFQADNPDEPCDPRGTLVSDPGAEAAQ